MKQQPLEQAHLILVKNPKHHSKGDFSLADNGQLSTAKHNRHTFSGIGVYHPKIFAGHESGKFKLGPILKAAADKGLVSGEKLSGLWMDIGTPERLKELEKYLKN